MIKIFITLVTSLILATSSVFAQEITSGEAIDLGLPSGTIWAAWNVGASSPEEYGDYYAWGETITKKNFSGDGNTYKYYDKTARRYIYIGCNISGSQYDVARQKWGGLWRMPTKKEIDEIKSKCSWEKCQHKGVDGCKIIGPNGNSIFIPFAGCRFGTSFGGVGSDAYYWSASLYEDRDGSGKGAYYLYFGSDDNKLDYCFYRLMGFPIRPVKSK